MKPQPRPPRPLTAKAIARAIRKELELVECDRRLRRENIAQHLPAIIAILAQNQNAPLAEALAFEKAIQTYKGNDAATRLMYADWLRERGLTEREAEVRREAADMEAGSEIGTWMALSCEAEGDAEREGLKGNTW